MSQVNIRISSGAAVLNGTIILPESAARALVILIPGSGPIKQSGISEEMEKTTRERPFEAWGGLLAAGEFASLRYDKRHSYTEHWKPDECQGLADEYGQDLDGVISFAFENPMLAHLPLVLLGHSLGAIAALEQARENPHVRGVIVIAGPQQDLPGTLKKQIRAYLASNQPSEPNASAIVQQIEMLDQSLKGSDDKLVFGIHPQYWRDYAGKSLDSLIPIVAAQVPVLLVAGDNDPLVDMTEFHRLCGDLQAFKNVCGVAIPGVDHFLCEQASTAERRRYKLEGILQWLTNHFPHFDRTE